MQSINDLRAQNTYSTGGGFAFAIAYGITHCIVGVLTYVILVEQAALALMFQGILAMPLSFLIMRVADVREPKDNPLSTLGIYLAISQVPAIAAFIVIFNIEPLYLPAIFAMVGATHFVPYGWLHQSRAWLVLSAGMTIIPYALLTMTGRDSFHYIPLAVGAMLISTGIYVYTESRAASASAEKSKQV
jgi:hypothetical protein